MRCYCVMHHGQPLELIEKEMPKPVGTEVLVRVTAAGLCHTDLHIWEGYYDLGAGKRLNLSDRGIKPPIVLSHEICGEVVSAGEGAGDVKLGGRFVVHPWIGCGECPTCLRGDENICSKSRPLGVARPGGFADYVLVPHPRYLVDIDGLNDAEAAPLACAGVTTYSAIRKLGEGIHHEPVVIIGAGGLGLMAIEVLRALGGQGAVVVDIDPAKREAALAAGALAVVDGKAVDAAQQLIAATQGGAGQVLDLVGSSATVSLAMQSARRGGHIVICGLMGGELTLPLATIPLRPLRIEGSYVGTLSELRELVDLVRRTAMKSIPVSRRPMSQVNQVIDDLHRGQVIGRAVLLP
ncbi:alcohol dehydrogenase [Ralstonia insidiosa]|jgi:D-arabinose 1-dehydrogenase-like Zn-dependent alcohol dehydrogenase|uniref:alcohol dehydrogenase n=1 Tax=Ralstonia TaxID=48736 RepID=UPI000CED8632|nr:MULTISPECIES: alcohol dehydrogenase [Ralstonia]KAB0471131.1 alcohol dehydrogenase catalytic domain-containing protein [Ralstonia insidiosa]MBY4909354.1 alcohol dehydrogenase [Ralstonia insidiosa]MDH6643365.1 D-arabinose 1-dehydrogenase-like Zn-dependent alcohol dehydrogenase [Ralstonia sp. GP73]